MDAKWYAALAAGWMGVALAVVPAGAQQQQQPQSNQLQTQPAPQLQFLQQPRAQQGQQAPAQQAQGQATAQQQQQETQAVPLSQAPSMRPEPISEERRAALDEAVRERLRIAFPSLHDNVRVEVTDVGVVRLTGAVGSVAAQLAVGNVASQVSDYEYLVLNDVTVRPPARQDQAIAQDIRQAFAADPYLRGSNVEVNVRNQTAILEGGASAEGLVDELVVLDRALQIAARIPGVRAVDTGGLL
jgi:osmotically-inducible protein OsmY